MTADPASTTTTESPRMPQLRRRALLRGGALAVSGLAAAALLGCGGDDEEEDAVGQGSVASPTATTGGKSPADIAKEWGSAYPFQFPEPDSPPKKGGTFRWSTNWDPATFDPSTSQAGGTMGPTNIVYNRLLGYKRGVHFDPFKLEFEPEIAKQWEVSPDGLTYTFKLAPSVKWQNVEPLNGRPFIANDVKLAYDRYAGGGLNKGYFQSVDRITAVDDTTLNIGLKQPEPDFLSPLASRYLTLIPHELADDGTTKTRMVGTGPMIMKRLEAGTRLVFERNPEFFEREVLLDGMEVLLQPDAAARLAGFRAKQTDYAYAIVDTVSDVKALLATNPDIQINANSPINYGSTFALQLRNPKWQDARVRRALNLALDFENESQILAGGAGWHLPSTPWFWLFDQRPSGEAQLGRWWRYDPKEATQLLQAAGATDLEFDYPYFTYSSLTARQAELYTDVLQRIGVKMHPAAIDYTSYNSQWVGGTFKDTTYGWVPFGFAPNTPFYEQVHSKSGSNRWGITDTEIDSWAERQRVELNVQARKELHRKIWDKMQDQIYYVTLGQSHTYSVYQPWLRNVRNGGALIVSIIYYDLGDSLGEAWLDK